MLKLVKLDSAARTIQGAREQPASADSSVDAAGAASADFHRDVDSIAFDAYPHGFRSTCSCHWP